MLVFPVMRTLFGTIAGIFITSAAFAKEETTFTPINTNPNIVEFCQQQVAKQLTSIDDGLTGNLDLVALYNQCHPESENFVPQIVWCNPDDGGETYYTFADSPPTLENLDSDIDFLNSVVSDFLEPFETNDDIELEAKKTRAIEMHQQAISNGESFLRSGIATDCSIS